MFFVFHGVYCDNKIGGVVLENEYPFEIIEISPVYLAESEARKRIEQMVTKLLEILDGE